MFRIILSFFILCANKLLSGRKNKIKREKFRYTFFTRAVIFRKSNKLTIINKSNTGKFTYKTFEFTKENFYFVATYNQIRLMEILLEKITTFQQKVRSKEISEFLQSV